MEKISEIKGAVASFHNDTNQLKLRTRWQDDFNYYRLKPYNAGKGYFSYTSNAPRVLADKVISMLCDSKLLIRVPEDLLTDEQAKTANNVERFLYGSFNLNDEKFLYLPDMPPLRHQMAWYAVVRGSFAIWVYVHKKKNGKTMPNIAVWDMYNVAFGTNEDGTEWAAYSYKIPRSLAEREYGIKSPNALVDAIDFVDTEKYGTIVDDKWIDGSPTPHNCGYCPVFILRAGATPPVWQKNYQYAGAHVGESVFSANRELFPIINKTLSDLMTMVRRGVKVPMGYWSASGDKQIEEDIFQVEKAASVPFQTGDEFKPLLPQTMPADTTPLLNILTGELQRGGLPHTAFGELGFRLSGFAINQLQTALGTVVIPFAQCLERAYTIGGLSLVEQYTKKGFAPIEVRGRTSRNQAFGYPIADKIKPSDIKGNWRPEITLEPVFPKDDAQRYQLARLAREGEIPLLADETIRSELLGVQDADLEAQKIAGQWADNLIINRLWKAYLDALFNENQMKAQNILMELRRLMAMQQPQQGRQQGGAPSPTETASMGAPGVGMPPQDMGVPASTLPPEAMGGMPPGAQNARMAGMSEEEF